MNQGDILEIIVRDGSYTPYFKAKARINNRNEMSKLFKELRDKGIEFPLPGWFE